MRVTFQYVLLIRTLCLLIFTFDTIFICVFHLIHRYGSSDLDVLRLMCCTLFGSQIGITHFSLTCISILVGHLASVLLLLKFFHLLLPYLLCYTWQLLFSMPYGSIKVCEVLQMASVFLIVVHVRLPSWSTGAILWQFSTFRNLCTYCIEFLIQSYINKPLPVLIR